MFSFPLIVAEPPLSPTSGRVEGEVKLSISYRNSTLFIMVMHIKDLVNTHPETVFNSVDGVALVHSIICVFHFRFLKKEQIQTRM